MALLLTGSGGKLHPETLSLYFCYQQSGKTTECSWLVSPSNGALAKKHKPVCTHRYKLPHLGGICLYETDLCGAQI